MKKAKPLIIGLTGGIGMGKSAAAKILKSYGLPVHNADRVVHALLQKGGKGVKPVARLFPEALRRDAIDRKKLGALVFGQPQKLKQLEGILHPLVGKAEKEFLRAARQKGVAAVILEIPLLFETGAEVRCDVTLCVTAPKAVQKQRVMQRKDMTAARFKAILQRQMPDSEKRRRADYVVKTGINLADTKAQLRAIFDRVISNGSPCGQPGSRAVARRRALAGPKKTATTKSPPGR